MKKNIISKYAIIIYLGITFALSWPIAFYLLTTIHINNAADVFPPSMVIGGILLGLAPSFTGIILSNFLHIPLLNRLKLRSPKKLYLLAILFVPLTTFLCDYLTNLTITHWTFTFNILPLIMGLIWPVFSSCGEEFGWRGFLLPQLLEKYSPFTSTTIIGTIWGIWHIPMFWLSYRHLPNTGIIMTFLQAFNLLLLSYLMTALHISSKGDIKLSILFHYTITAMGILPNSYLLWPNSNEFTTLNSLVISIVIRILIILFIFIKKDKSINS